jgi:hypothetical protein
VIAEAGQADAGVFLSRLLRLDPAALVRIQAVRPDSARFFAMLPFRVLAEKVLPARSAGDVTVAASALLASLDDPGGGGLPRLDARWRWPLPPGPGWAVEVIPAAEVRRIAEAAASTLRTAATEGVSGRPVGARMLREALLDHVPIVVTDARGHRVEVPQRLVQGLVRMGFDGDASSDVPVTVCLAANWTGLRGLHGSVWFHPPLSIRLT